MTDLFDFNLISDRTSTKSRRTYSQRNVSSLQIELTKNRKMINVNTSKTTILNRTISFRPLSEISSSPSPSLTNVENTPMKKPVKESKTPSRISLSKGIIEETPIKEEEQQQQEEIENDKMSRDIQRLSHRLRSSIPLYDLPVYDNQSAKPATLHLSQVVNRVSRCNYVLRRFVREAEKYVPKTNDEQLTSKTDVTVQSHEKGRRRLFVDSPKQDVDSNPVNENQPPITPRKASGVIKQLFASPSSSFKRMTSNTNIINHDKRAKLF